MKLFSLTAKKKKKISPKNVVVNSYDVYKKNDNKITAKSRAAMILRKIF